MSNDNLISQRALPAGTVLNNTYVITKILGEGGFGITYLGYHKSTSKSIAIKEYFPSELASRAFSNDKYYLQIFNEKSAEDYHKGQQRFLIEAKHLQDLKHLDSIVTIFDCFEENNTAYIIMEYIEGPTLYQYVKDNGTFLFSEFLDLLTPLMQSLISIHKNGLIHRDISPDNLILGMDNQLHLIDFGAASKKNLQSKKKKTIILKSGYAPPEQYLTNEKMGAWVDVYALCATTYFALTGTAPPPAVQRLQKDFLQPLSMTISIQPWQSAAIEKGLQLHPADRFRDVEDLYQALTTPSYLEKTPTVLLKPSLRKLSWNPRYFTSKVTNKKKLIGFAGIVLLIGVLIIKPDLFIFSANQQTSEKKETVSPVSTTMSDNDSKAEISKDTPSPTQPELLTMPDFSGYSLKKAKLKLHQLDSNITVKTKRKYNKKIPSNHIISQNVAEGTLFTEGQLPTIQFIVSRGGKSVKDESSEKKTPEYGSNSQTPAPTPKQTSKPSSKKKFNVKAAEDDEYATIYRN